MEESSLRELLSAVGQGSMSINDAVTKLRHLPFEDLGFAKIDHHRGLRCGIPEVIYCEGKTIDQVVQIFTARMQTGGNVLGTRADAKVAEAIQAQHPKTEYNALARTVTLRQQEAKPSTGTIAIVAAGTSDLPVAEEAKSTCEIMDQRTATFYDVGVAGLHRLLAQSEAIQQAAVVIVTAGMEGALASVVGGLVSVPVIAVPTSVGYGASFGGIAPLLTMLNCCAAGVSVVNIDNGFNAGYIATLINRTSDRTE